MTGIDNETHPDRNNGGGEAPAQWPGVTFPFQARSCYAVIPAGEAAVIVRSRRVSLGRVRHGIVASADAVAWQQWLMDAGRPGNVVVGCMMVQASLTLWLQTPFASITKAKKVLPALLDVQLPFPLESCHYRLVDIRRMPDGTTHALVVAARRESLRTRLEAYRAERLNPVLLDHEGLALWTQSREEWPLPAEAHRLILHVDTDHVTLVIGQGDRYQNAYSIQVHLPSLTAAADSRGAGRARRAITAHCTRRTAGRTASPLAGLRRRRAAGGADQRIASAPGR